jgi:hypothetical protein
MAMVSSANASPTLPSIRRKDRQISCKRRDADNERKRAISYESLQRRNPLLRKFAGERMRRGCVRRVTHGNPWPFTGMPANLQARNDATRRCWRVLGTSDWTSKGRRVPYRSLAGVLADSLRKAGRVVPRRWGSAPSRLASLPLTGYKASILRMCDTSDHNFANASRRASGDPPPWMGASPIVCWRRDEPGQVL